MPLIDSNDPENWNGGPQSLYRAWAGITPVGYQKSTKREWVGDGGWCADQLETVLRGLGLLKTQRIAFIGAGFGYVAERFLELGYGPLADGTANGRVLSVDTSTFIQANKGNQANVPIFDADVNASTGQRLIRQQFGSNNAEVHWVVDEDILPILIGEGPTPGGNNEVVPFCQNLRTLASTGVAHWVSVLTVPGAQDPRLNWKTLQEWKNWVSPDIVISRQGGAVL